MQELLTYIITSIVQNPSSVNITKEENGEEVTLFVSVAQEDRGVVIGKEGRNIKAIRNLVSIIARRENKRLNIKVVD